MTDYSEYTDHRLADLLRSGDEAVFKIIYDKYWPKLFFVAAKRLNDTCEAEEVVQDIFLNLWKKRENFHLKVGFDNYLAVAVKFEVFKRRALRAKQTTFTENLTKEYEAKAHHDTNLYDLQALQEQLDETINTLPNKCKLVFTMSRDTDMTNKKIALELGITEKAVEKHITIAFKILRTRFGQYFSLILILNGFL